MNPASLVARRPRNVNGRDVLVVLLSFFGVIFAVNGALIYAAVSTHTGLVANEPYRKGLAYNERILADERQAQLGWSERLEVGRDGHLRLALAERDSGPVRGLRVQGVLGRAATNRHDINLAFVETAPGQYEAQGPELAAGSWLISLEARTVEGAQGTYRLRRRLWLRP
jgi:nitrogen fixation protein FixH